MKLNQNGFTFIEILGAVIILGLLTTLTLNAFMQYLDWARKKAYDNLAKSASTAAEQYVMDYPHASIPEADAFTERAYDIGVSFDDLNEKGYLSDITDPMGGSCKGKVVIGFVEADENNKRSLDKYMFVVHECCTNYRARYTYTYEIKQTYEKDKNGNQILVDRLTPVNKISKQDVICK